MVRPIELQEALSKTPAAEKVQQVRQTAPDLQQRQIAQQAEARSAQRQERVEEPEQGDEVTLSSDLDEEKDLPKREGDRESQEEEPESERSDDGEHGLIDFRV